MSVWLNRGKESVELDLKSGHGRRVLAALVQQLDGGGQAKGDVPRHRLERVAYRRPRPRGREHRHPELAREPVPTAAR